MAVKNNPDHPAIAEPEVRVPERKKQDVPKNAIHTYSKILARQLKAFDSVKKHPELTSGKWTKKHYEILAALISEDLKKTLSKKKQMTLGTTISYRTLRKIVLEDYKITHPVDPRTLNTLNKVVAFLGYENWDHFVSKAAILQQEYEKEANPEQQVTDVVKEAAYNEYHAYYRLPELDENALTATHIKNGPAFNFVMELLLQWKSEKLIISNDFNPSTYEILDIAVKKLEANYAQVHTKEYWLLCWWDTRNNRYARRYKNISDHFYILKKENGKWKVKTNASTADPMELH